MAARPGRGPVRPHRKEARRDGAPELIGRERPRERGADHSPEAPDLDHVRLLADYDATMGAIFGEVEQAFVDADGDWPARMRAALERLLTLAACNPEQTRLCTIGIFEAGPEGLEWRDAWMTHFTGLCQRGYAEAVDSASQPRLMPSIAAGALFELIRAHASEGRLAKLPEALPTALLIVLAPVVGRDTALALAAADGRGATRRAGGR